MVVGFTDDFSVAFGMEWHVDTTDGRAQPVMYVALSPEGACDLNRCNNLEVRSHIRFVVSGLDGDKLLKE